ncbi:MAG TPA: DUF4234 domain-containing protein [Thermoleophilaceae bacterium]|nr:DUF4234 domain-containing protein [Thermoleophilaceae bacterium]
MAEEVQIQGSGELAKIRHPLGILGLMLITLGIYFFVWWYKVNSELAELGRARGTTETGDNPTTSLLAMIPGFLIIVPPYVSFYKGSNRLRAAERLTGRPAGIEAGLMLVLYFFIAPVAIYIFQSDLNKVLEAQRAGVGQIPEAAPAPPPPAQAAAKPETPPPPSQQ